MVHASVRPSEVGKEASDPRKRWSSVIVLVVQEERRRKRCKNEILTFRRNAGGSELKSSCVSGTMVGNSDS